MRFSHVAGLLLPLVLLVSCGDDADVKPSDGESANVAEQSSDVTESASPNHDVELPSEDTLETYFNGVSRSTLDSVQEALDAAQPGSPAAAYATYIGGYLQAGVDGGTPYPEGSEVTKIDGGFRKCEGTGKDEECFDFTDIEGADGKVSNFSVNDRPIGPRLSVGTDVAVKAKGGEAQATFIAAFEGSSGGNLFVVVSVKAGPNGVGSIEGSYRSAEGRQSQSAQNLGPNELDSGALANVTFTFPSAKIGGTVNIKVYDQDFANESVITLKTR